MGGRNVWLDVNGDWTNVLNWSLGVAPVNTDDVYMLAGNKDIDTHLNQAGITLNSLTISLGFKGTLGTAAADFQIGSPLDYIGQQPGDGSVGVGSRRIRLDKGSTPFTSFIYGTCRQSADAGLESVRYKGTGSGNILVVTGGRVGFGTSQVTDTGALDSISVQNTGIVTLGYDVSWTDADIGANGTFNDNSGGGTNITVSQSGKAYLNGPDAVTNMNVTGYLAVNGRPSSGSLAALIKLYATGVLDFKNNPASGTVDQLDHYVGGQWMNHPAVPNHITVTTYNKVNGGTLVLE